MFAAAKVELKTIVPQLFSLSEIVAVWVSPVHLAPTKQFGRSSVPPTPQDPKD